MDSSSTRPTNEYYHTSSLKLQAFSSLKLQAFQQTRCLIANTEIHAAPNWRKNLWSIKYQNWTMFPEGCTAQFHQSHPKDLCRSNLPNEAILSEHFIITWEKKHTSKLQIFMIFESISTIAQELWLQGKWSCYSIPWSRCMTLMRNQVINPSLVISTWSEQFNIYMWFVDLNLPDGESII